MPAYTFFYDGELLPGIDVTMSHEEAHHLEHVMRVKVSESIDLMNGRGVLFSAVVQALGKKCMVKVQTCKKKTEAPTSFLEMVQGMPALNKSDWIVEKLTELGATHITFFGADRSPRQTLSESQANKLRVKSIQACKQSGRLWLPHLRWLENLDAWQSPEGSLVPTLVLLDPSGHPLGKLNVPKGSSLSAFIGPESGLSEKELEKLRLKGVFALSIHEHILRSETASMAATALLYTLQNSERFSPSSSVLY